MITSNTERPATGTGNLFADLAILAILVIVGTVLAVWFLSMPLGEREQLLARSLSSMTLMMALVLAQPGVYWTVKVLTNMERPLSRRLSLGLTVFVFGAFAIPVWISMSLGEYLQGLIR